MEACAASSSDIILFYKFDLKFEVKTSCMSLKLAFKSSDIPSAVSVDLQDLNDEIPKKIRLLCGL